MSKDLGFWCGKIDVSVFTALTERFASGWAAPSGGQFLKVTVENGSSLSTAHRSSGTLHGGPPEDVGITAGVPQIADNFLRRPSRKPWAMTGEGAPR